MTRQSLQRHAVGQKQPKAAASVVRPAQEQAERLRVGDDTLQSFKQPAMPTFRGLSHEPGGQATSPLVVQAKMRVGEVNDRYEQEADRLAPLIVQQINAPGFEENLQDSQSDIQEEAPPKQLQALRPTLQLKGQSTGFFVSPAIESAINSARGGGQPLEPRLQLKLGQAMNADFSRVRVHTDARADALNDALGSIAFTTQQDVFFRQGEYQPKNLHGQRLLAHELSHSIQQITYSGSQIQADFFEKKNPGTVWAYLQQISIGYGLPGEDSELLKRRQEVLKHIGNPGALYARFAKEQIDDLMELKDDEKVKLKDKWGWKDPISRENEVIGSDHSLETNYRLWRDKAERTQLDKLQWVGSRPGELEKDPVLTRLKSEYEEERVKALANDAPSFAWQGKMYDPLKPFEQREVRIYDTGTAVSADTGKRAVHALATPIRGVKSAGITTGKGLGEIVKHGMHLDAARKAGKLENASKVKSVGLKTLALAGAAFIPQLGALIKAVDDMTSQGVEEWLVNQQAQYNAQIALGEGFYKFDDDGTPMLLDLAKKAFKRK